MFLKKEEIMPLDVIFAGSLLYLSVLIFIKTRATNNQFLKDEANRCLSSRCEVSNIENLNFEGREYTLGTALLRNKKTGELRFINQAKLCNLGLID